MLDSRRVRDAGAERDDRHLCGVTHHGHRALLLKLAIVIIATLWNLRGAVSVGHGSIRMMAISLAPFAVLLLIAIWRIQAQMVADIAGVKLTRHHNLKAPKGVNGRNSDNTLIKKYLGWAPGIRLRDGMERTYRWIYE